MNSNNQPEFSEEVMKLLMSNSSALSNSLNSNLNQSNINKPNLNQQNINQLIQNNNTEIKQKHDQLLESTTDQVAVQRADGQSSYIAATTWEELSFSGDLLQGIYQKGFNKPSKIQAAALPLIIGQMSNLIAQAKNGSGKTATFALCMLSNIDKSAIHPQALCLAPTRELTLQIAKVIEELGRFMSIVTYLSIPQNNHYNPTTGGQIIVGTPGKTLDLLKRRAFPSQYIKIFVVDEADEMIDLKNKMGPQVQSIRQFFNKNIQMLLFSATFSDSVSQFAESIVPNAHKISVQTQDLSLFSVSQFYMICNDFDHKLQTLSDLYSSMAIGQSVIFVKSRVDAFKLANAMRQAGHAVSLICGTQSSGPDKMDHALRDQIMSEFRSGETRVLICTDILSRGIDVPQVTLVINYDLPLDFSGRTQSSHSAISMETYLHRIGRTGRFGLKGIAISLILPYEIAFINDICNFYSFQITELKNDLEEIENMVKQLRS